VENFDAGRYFVINDTTGEIRTSSNIDRESTSSMLSYTVQAIDKSKIFKLKLTLAFDDPSP
jgi:hypothetical protein